MILNLKKCDSYGFVCECSLCQIDRADPKYAEREAIVRKFRESYKGNYHKCSLKTLVDYENKVKSMCKPGQKYQSHMNSPLIAYAYYYRAQNDSRRSAETFMKLFELNKDIDNLFSFKLLFLTLLDYSKLPKSNKESAKVAEILKKYFVGNLEISKYAYDLDHLGF